MLGLPIALLAAAGCRRALPPGTIVIGASPTGVPFSFVDPWTNELAGVMVDVARAAVCALRLQPVFAITPFAGLVPSLQTGKIDVIAAALLRTPERSGAVAFSDPVFPYPAGLVMQERDPRHPRNLAALRDLRVGVQFGTRFVDQLKNAEVRQIRTYDSLSDILREIDFGRIDAGYGDAPILRYQLRVGPKHRVRIEDGFRPPADEHLSLILRKDDRRMEAMNHAIAGLRGRTIPAVARKWGIAA